MMGTAIGLFMCSCSANKAGHSFFQYYDEVMRIHLTDDEKVEGAALSTDRRQIVAAVDVEEEETLRVWDVMLREQTQIIKFEDTLGASLHFSPDGEFLLAYSGDSVTAYDVAADYRLMWRYEVDTYQIRHTLIGTQGRFIEDGRTFLSDGLIWDVGHTIPPAPRRMAVKNGFGAYVPLTSSLFILHYPGRGGTLEQVSLPGGDTGRRVTLSTDRGLDMEGRLPHVDAMFIFAASRSLLAVDLQNQKIGLVFDTETLRLHNVWEFPDSLGSSMPIVLALDPNTDRLLWSGIVFNEEREDLSLLISPLDGRVVESAKDVIRTISWSSDNCFMVQGGDDAIVLLRRRARC
jgi:hypothetical protein